MPRTLLFLALLGVGGYVALSPAPSAQPNAPPAPLVKPVNPAPPCPGPGPCPTPQPQPKPKPKPSPWGNGPAPGPGVKVIGKIQTGSHVSPTGIEAMIDFPPSEWMKNIGSHVNGAGMCVSTSIEMSLRWENRDEFRGFRDWAATFTGGGWPERVDWYFSEYAKKKGLPPAQYLQYQGRDPSIMQLALQTGRMVAITYDGRDGVWYSGPISHMICLVHYDSERDEVAVMDNNNGGPNSKLSSGEVTYLWMNVKEFMLRWTSGKNGWCVIPLYAPPPLPPVNAGPFALLSKQFSPFSPVGQTPFIHGKPSHPYTDGKPAQTDYQWSIGHGGYWLYQGSKKIGAWFTPENEYRPYDAKKDAFGEPCPPPVSPPGADAPTGVNKLGIGEDEIYTINGWQVDRDDALRMVADAKLEDDTGKLKVTVIGDDASRKQVTNDLASDPALKVFAGKVLVQSYPPNHWAVAPGFVTAGKPTICFQYGGKVMHRQDEYRGPAKLAEALTQALRKADPNYHPEADPDLNKTPAPSPGPPLPLPDLSGIVNPNNRAPILLLVMGGLAWLFLSTSTASPGVKKS